MIETVWGMFDHYLDSLVEFIEVGVKINNLFP
jgi:hypothetical protein